eukprot:scaffold96573_cov52-Attheya_sp.AAC.5
MDTVFVIVISVYFREDVSKLFGMFCDRYIDNVSCYSHSAGYLSLTSDQVSLRQGVACDPDLDLWHGGIETLRVSTSDRAGARRTSVQGRTRTRP